MKKPKENSRRLEFLPLAQNPNKHTPKGMGMLDAAMGRHGYVAPMTAAADGAILDGNARLETAATKFPGVEPIIVEHDGTRPIIAVRTDIPNADDPMARDIIVTANRVAEVDLDYDLDVLRGFAAEGLDLGLFEFDAGMLEEIGGARAGLTDPDAVPEERATDIQPGDLFSLGEHRLLCGDSTKAADVARVMGGEKAILCVTDPPYGVDFKGAKYNPGAKHWKGIEGDKRQGGELRQWLGAAIVLWLEHIEPDAAFYFWTAAMNEGSAAAAVQDAGLHIQSQIVWVKNSLVLGQADYHWRHENCWYAFKKGARHRWFGERDKTTVWEVDKVAHANYEHPMQKPTELFAIPMRNHTCEGEMCFEPFSGSGSQLMAGEQLSRRVSAIEMSPSYCQVAIDRWEQFTGKRAVQLS